MSAREVVAPTLPAWWEDFTNRVCEIPDRNSPEDEPEAIVATLEELAHCALNAIEDTPAADPRLAAAERVAKALETDLAEHDPEDFGCACEPGHTCGPCRERNRQKPLRAALSEYRSTK